MNTTTPTSPLERLSAIVAAMTDALAVARRDQHPVPFVSVREWRNLLADALAEQVRVDAQLHQQIEALREMVAIRDECDEPITDLLDRE